MVHLSWARTVWMCGLCPFIVYTFLCARHFLRTASSFQRNRFRLNFGQERFLSGSVDFHLEAHAVWLPLSGDVSCS